MSIRRKIEEGDLIESLTKRLENTLFDLLDDDDPVSIYMLTDICRQLKIDIEKYFPSIYISGHYNLKALSNGNFNTALDITEALYSTCIRFQKFDLALIVTSEVNKALVANGVNLHWIDGKFQ